jgi:hypothetical protein
MSWMAWLNCPTTTTLKGKKINLERRKVRLTFVTDGNDAVTQNLFHMPNSTTQRKKAQMASALFNDVQFLSFEAVRNTAEWDALTCDEQMRLEDLIATA